MQTFIIVGIVILLLIIILWIRKPLNYHNAGISKYNKGDYERAIEDFNKAIKINPLNANQFLYRGYSKMNLGNFQGAIDDYTEALMHQKPTSDLYMNRGASKHQIKDYKGAIEDYDKAIEMNPIDGDFYFNRSLSKEQIGDAEGALIDLNHAHKLGYKKTIHSNLASVEDQKQAESLTTVYSNVYLHDFVPSFDILKFDYLDFRFRCIVFCLSTALKACEELIDSKDKVQDVCINFLSNFTTSNENVGNFFGEKINAEQAAYKGSQYLSKYLEDWETYYEKIEDGNEEKATEILRSMIQSIGSNKQIEDPDEEQLNQLCWQIEFSLKNETMRGAFSDLLAKKN